MKIVSNSSRYNINIAIVFVMCKTTKTHKRYDGDDESV